MPGWMVSHDWAIFMGCSVVVVLCPPLWVMFYGLEYCVFSCRQFIVNLVFGLGFLVYVEALQCVQHPSFFRDVNDLHNFIHFSYCASIIQEVLGEFRFPIIVLKISHVFLESALEWSSCLTGVRQLARWRTHISWMLFPEGRSSELRLRRGVGQAEHTLNNPQVECTGVLLCVIRE